MKPEVVFEDLGPAPYKEAWNYQEQLLKQLQEKKLHLTEGKKDIPDGGYLLFCEHPHVYTLGRSGKENNLLIPPERLAQEHISYFHTNRGGDITYHGPGQIVGYPIIDLDLLQIGVKKYIALIEETIIRTLAEIGLGAGKLKDATGVWMHLDGNQMPKKICAIGVRVSRGITMHGFAFNVNTDLRFFDYINPCGFTDKGVTSVEKETGRKWNFEEMKQRVRKQFGEVFQVHLTGQ